MAGGVAVPSRIPGDESWSEAAKESCLRNEAQLYRVSLRSRFDCVARRGLSRVKMNALRAPLTALSAREEKCRHFLLDNADVVIDGSLLRCVEKNPAQSI